MEAVVCQAFGPVTNLSVQQMPEPAPGAGEVLIHVASVGVNFPDALLIRGLYQVKPSLPFIPGIECAGTIAALGEDVTGFAVGDRVVAMSPRFGTYAAAVAVPASHTYPIPDALDFDHAGALIEMYYVGDTDLNRDNAPAIAGNANNLDEISFIAEDDGISIDLVNNRFVYGQRKTAPLATAEITILPQNDVPIANDDEIRMDVGNLDPATDVDSTAWEQFFAGGVVPVPTEDTPLTIPGAFLIDNDLRARASAADENIDPSESDNNDLRIVVASVAANWDTNTLGGSVTVNLVTGNVELVPPTDRFGDISFTYTIKDLGRNLFIDGSEELQILESSPATVTVAIQPVNDVPVAHDRSLAFTESGNDIADVFTFTAGQLLDGAGSPETPNTPHQDTTLPFPFNEATQQLRVVEFTTAAGTVGAPASGDRPRPVPARTAGRNAGSEWRHTRRC